MDDIKNRDDLPAMLKPSDIRKFLKIGQNDVYELMKQEGFPKVIKLSERRNRVPKEEFLAWLDSQRV